MGDQSILLHERDNVATAVTAFNEGDWVKVAVGNLSIDTLLLEDIPFGHKYALDDIAKGEEVFKYGLPIGKAVCDIRAGEWVHVHNCRSSRYGFYRDRYGIRA